MDPRRHGVPRARYLEAAIRDDALAARKMAFISGPRQVGKTTLGRALVPAPENVFTWDDARFRRAWVKDPVGAVAARATGPVLLDEIHKDRRFKNRLKGLFDLHGADLPIVVTGSARLDCFRRGGDSLTGRYLPYRLHPFTVAERPEPPAPAEILETTTPVFPFGDLVRLGGVPEPLLDGHEGKAIRWSRLRRERLVYEDLRDFRNIRDLQAMRVLVDLLPERVGSRLSINNLHEDVGVAYATVRDWIHVPACRVPASRTPLAVACSPPGVGHGCLTCALSRPACPHTADRCRLDPVRCPGSGGSREALSRRVHHLLCGRRSRAGLGARAA